MLFTIHGLLFFITFLIIPSVVNCKPLTAVLQNCLVVSLVSGGSKGIVAF